MPKWLRKRWRAVQLALLSRQNPEGLLRRSQERLPRVVGKALVFSPAYAELCRERGLSADQRLTPEQVLESAPVLGKEDLFERFPVHDLLRSDLGPADLANVLTSSGYGGGKFAFGLATGVQMRRTPDDIDLGLQLAFDIDARSTLLVNCLPMGVVFSSRDVCVANVSVREDMALAILDQAGPLYEQVILCIDPLFGKRLLDFAAQSGFDWSRLRCNLVIGEETFPEDFRTYVAECMQVDLNDPDAGLLGSSMGVGELGLNLFFETRETIALRRVLHARDKDCFQPAFFCFNPLRTHVEVLSPSPDGIGDLVITLLDTTAPIPMIRYRTGDRARWVTPEDLEGLPADLREELQQLSLPLIAMYGRAAGRVGEHWHVDHFKALIYRRPELARQCSGAFHLRQDEVGGIELEVQLGLDATAEPQWLQGELAALIDAMAAANGRPPVTITCLAHGEFPHGMGLDYERKFRYQGGT